jgi:nitrite reductase/ring-hydroxylating ferredoxin subunit
LDHRLLSDLLKGQYMNFEDLFLSMRFTAWREPDVFNHALFALLVNFDDRRLRSAERRFGSQAASPTSAVAGTPNRAEGANEDVFAVCYGGEQFLVQRYCPHMGADMSLVGQVHDGTITCARHGWQFRLSDGACVNVSGVRIVVRPGRLQDGAVSPSKSTAVSSG